MKKMIAKRIPERAVSGKRADVAIAYGLTVEEFNRASYDWLQSEGCTDDGEEFLNLHDWLTKPRKEYRDNTPYQKGDDWDI